MTHTKYTHHFTRVIVSNRWRQKWWNRDGNWVIFGISQRFFSVTDYEYRIHLFGIDIRFWFTREVRH